MERIPTILAFAVAAAIIAVAIFELDSRTNEGPIAIPTRVPSPIASPSIDTSPTLPPATARPAATAAATAAAVTTEPSTPAPSFSRTPRPHPTPERTVAPPRTPSPTPLATAPSLPLDRSRGQTPKTGGGALSHGLLLAGAAIALRAGIRRRRGSY